MDSEDELRIILITDFNERELKIRLDTMLNYLYFAIKENGKIKEDSILTELMQKAGLIYKNGTHELYVTLKGKIVSAVDGDLRVQLEEPHTGSSGIHYGFASAMSGHRIFKDDLTFTDNAIETAKGLLIGIYKKQKHYQQHKGTIDLASKLNQEGR